MFKFRSLVAAILLGGGLLGAFLPQAQAQGNRGAFVLEVKGYIGLSGERISNKYVEPFKVRMSPSFAYTIELEGRRDTTGKTTDTYLMIRDSRGTIVARDDDGGTGLNSKLRFQPTRDGVYTIVVTSYRALGKGLYTLRVYQGGRPAVTAKGPDRNLKATYGTAKLRVGFLPDPYSKQLTAGGSIDTKLGGVKARVAKAPDFKLYYTAGNRPLTIYAISSKDTTLLVNLPNGQWIANDDGGKGLNPQIKIARPQSGRYDIWVGTFSRGNAAARLYITELK